METKVEDAEVEEAEEGEGEEEEEEMIALDHKEAVPSAVEVEVEVRLHSSW